MSDQRQAEVDVAVEHLRQWYAWRASDRVSAPPSGFDIREVRRVLADAYLETLAAPSEPPAGETADKGREMLCLHCLKEGDWTDEDKCPKCEQSGHVSPWAVSACPACNQIYNDNIEAIKKQIDDRTQCSIAGEAFVGPLDAPADSERRAGRSKLVYDKATRTIVKASQPAPRPEPAAIMCLACGIKVELVDGDEPPRDDERCSHQWEELRDARPEPAASDVPSKIVCALKDFAEQLESGEPIEVTTVTRTDTPDGPMHTFRKSTEPAAEPKAASDLSVDEITEIELSDPTDKDYDEKWPGWWARRAEVFELARQQVRSAKPIEIMDDGPLHTLWSKAVGTDGYDKREWIALETKLHRAMADQKRFYSQQTPAAVPQAQTTGEPCPNCPYFCNGLFCTKCGWTRPAAAPVVPADVLEAAKRLVAWHGPKEAAEEINNGESSALIVARHIVAQAGVLPVTPPTEK